VEKSKYLDVALKTLSQVFSEGGAKATIDVMAKLKLKDVTDIDAKTMSACNSVLHERVRMLKGDETATKFYSMLNNACR
jgi:hypothetical protein